MPINSSLQLEVEGNPPLSRLKPKDKFAMNVNGSAVLSGNHLEGCTINQTIYTCCCSRGTVERDARQSDHPCVDSTDAEDPTRGPQTHPTTPHSPEGTTLDEAPSLLLTSSSLASAIRHDTTLDEASSLLLTPPSSASCSRQDSGVFSSSSLGSSLTRSDDYLIDRQEYRTYQTFHGMQSLCRTMAYTTHRVTLNRLGGIMFETVPFGAEVPIGNVKQLTVRLKTLHTWITGCRWHELHVGGWAIILKDDDDAERWRSDLCNIPDAQLDDKDYEGSRSQEYKVQHKEIGQPEASQFGTTSKNCTFAALKNLRKKKEEQMFSALAPDVLLKYSIAEVVGGSWMECSRCLGLSDHQVHDIQSWYTTCVERCYTVLDIFHEQCEKKSKNFVTEMEKRLSCLPQFQEIQRVLKGRDHLCVKDLCPGVLLIQQVHEVPSADVCQLISADHSIASQWTTLARLLGLSRSQMDVVRLECHNRPQPCQQSAAKVLSLWSTSGGTARSCSLATLLRVLKHMDQHLVMSSVLQHLQRSGMR